MKTNGIGCYSKEKGRRWTRTEREETLARVQEEEKLNPGGKVTDPKLKAALKEKRRLNKELRNGD